MAADGRGATVPGQAAARTLAVRTGRAGRIRCSRRSGRPPRRRSRGRRWMRRNHPTLRAPAIPPATRWNRSGCSPPAGLGRAASGDLDPGRAGAHERLDDFVDGAGRRTTRSGRDSPGVERHQPRLSAASPLRRDQSLPHLARASRTLGRGAGRRRDLPRELGWREFGWHALRQPAAGHPATSARVRPLRLGRPPPMPNCDAWQQGRTGYPLVDAGMRELWQTGWMHNRVRMVAASFLVKNLLADWRLGEALVLGHPGGRRRRQQPGELAVGGGLRRRRLSVLPDLQPGHPEQEVRRRAPATCASTSRSCPGWTTNGSTNRGRRMVRPRVTRDRLSGCRSPVPGRWRPTSGSRTARAGPGQPGRRGRDASGNGCGSELGGRELGQQERPGSADPGLSFFSSVAGTGFEPVTSGL